MCSFLLIVTYAIYCLKFSCKLKIKTIIDVNWLDSSSKAKPIDFAQKDFQYLVDNVGSCKEQHNKFLSTHK